MPVGVAGNVGTALRLAGRRATCAAPTVVCEASSFQLEDTLAFAPEAAVLLNLEPDHLDRHGTLEAYRDAKLQAFARQGPDGRRRAPPTSTMPGARARGSAPLEIRDGALCARGASGSRSGCAGRTTSPTRPRPPRSPGPRRRAARAGLRRSPASSTGSRRSTRIDGVLYVNDSKATNVASTLVALASFNAPVHLILGGQGKGQDFTPLRAAGARARGVYLIGEDAERIGEAVGGEPLRRPGARRVARPPRGARRGDVVLLSPACASFDQFADFEARGRAFKELVRARRSSGA